MTRILTAIVVLLGSWSGAAQAETPPEAQVQAVVQEAVLAHVLPRVDAFARSAATLNRDAQAGCTDLTALQDGFHAAMDDWTRMSHLRFGPTEAEDRAFALAFWPDARGKTPKALTGLLRAEGTAQLASETFAEVSIAARGLYAMEVLLFDAPIRNAGSTARVCLLIQSVARDIAANARSIAADWHSGYGAEMIHPSAQGIYHTPLESLQELFKAATTGLQFTAQTRLGRPLGTFERPRPRRAELRRSERSLRQVEIAMEGVRDLALILAESAPALRARLESGFARVLSLIAELDDPSLAGVAETQGRLRVEIIQLEIADLRDVLVLELGPALGVSTGFNALDGD